jgi:hypothetical protein
VLPEVIVTNDALLTAVHVHDEAAVTVTLPMIAVSPTVWLVGVMDTQFVVEVMITTTSSDAALVPQAFFARTRT